MMLLALACIGEGKIRSQRPQRKAIHVESIALARDNGGTAGVRVDAFVPSDNPMHFLITLTDVVPGTRVRATLMAVVITTGEQEVKVGAVERTTRELENQMDATMTLPRDWPTGAYRIEVALNGKLDQSRTFLVTCERPRGGAREPDPVGRRSQVLDQTGPEMTSAAELAVAPDAAHTYVRWSSSGLAPRW
jgi:hypothetical protein